MKKCSRCKQTKELKDFHTNKCQKQGVSNQCRDCVRLSAAEYRAREKAKIIHKEIESLPEEEWRWVVVDGIQYQYKISNFGRLASYKLIQPYIMSTTEEIKTRRGGVSGYLSCSIRSPDNKSYHSTRVHRLVAIAFLPNPSNFPQINHKDGNKGNNHVTNLEWCECSYNIHHAFLMGVVPRKSGEESHMYDDGRRIIHVPSGKAYNSISGASRDLKIPRTTLNAELRGYRKPKHGVVYE